MSRHPLHEKIVAAELALARKQELLDAIDLVLYELREFPGLHGCLPSLRATTADITKRLAETVRKLRGGGLPP